VKFVYLIAFVCLAAAVPAGAQQSLENGSVSGRVLDATGAAVPMARVTARHADTNVSTVSETDDQGRFRLPYLRIGHYEIVVTHPGFQDASRSVTVNAGAAFDLTVSLDVAGVTSQVAVTATVPVLDTARTQIASTVSAEEVRTVPMNGRNFVELALLVPGVSPANTNSNQLFPETSAAAGVSLAVSSQRNLSNNFIVDGLSANDDAAALSGIAVGVDAIEQFQVVTSGGQAELGRALGGYINVVTKSGTNVRHGDAYYFGRDGRLNARNPLTSAKLPMDEHQYGGSLGGPIVRDRTFYFTNIEHRDLDQSGVVTIAPEVAAAINARLDAVGYQGPHITTGVYPNPLTSTTVLSKVTHAIDTRDQLAVRYSWYDIASDNARGAGGLNAPSASAGLDNRDQTIAASNTLVLASRTVLESRAQVAFSDLGAPPTDPVGPAVTVAGVATFGTLSNSPTARKNTMVQAVNNLSHETGRHALRAGVDLLYNRDSITFPRSNRGSYTFQSLAAFLAGTYNNAGFTQTFGATGVLQTNPNLGVYAQDEWHAAPGLTLNLGVRYDLQFLDTIYTDTDNLSPRAGIAWTLSDSQRTVIRASGGLFYDRVPLRAVANALLSAGNTTDPARLRQLNVTLSPGQAAAPAFPQILAAPVPSVTLPNLTTIDRHLQNAYSRQASVEIEHQFGARSTVSAGYQYVRGVGLLMSINQNVPSCVAAGANNGCRPNPDYANNSQYSAAGSSSYHGLHVSLVQQPVGWGHYRVSYTLSKSMNDVGEFFFSSPIDPFDVSKDWGRSDDDQRHRLAISGSVRTPTEPATSTWQRVAHGFEASGTLLAYSAYPFNISSGSTTVQGTAARPLVNGAFIERNAGQGTPYLNLSLRVSRRFSMGSRRTLEVMAEGFNLTNHENVLSRNTTFGSGPYPTEPAPTFGQVTAVSEPRSVQLSARFHF
jgi:outer membrane receptor protein involved in Fe transport